MMHSIDARSVTKAYPLAGGGERIALADIDFHVDFHVAFGEFVCLLGPPGCEKTALLNILSGLEVADSGSVIMRARHGAVGENRLHVSGVAHPTLAQGPENIRFVLHRRSGSADTVRYCLERVGLAGRGEDYPRQLSIGQQQRVAEARAL